MLGCLPNVYASLDLTPEPQIYIIQLLTQQLLLWAEGHFKLHIFKAKHFLP